MNHRLRSPYRLLALLLLSIPLLASHAAAQTQPDPTGTWEGTIEIPGQQLGVTVKLARDAAGALTGTIDIPMQRAKDLPLTSIASEAANISFVISGIPGNPTFRGILSLDGSTLSGNFSQGGSAFPFKLTRKSAGSSAEEKASMAATLDGLRTFINGAMKDTKVPGVAVAIVRDGEVIFSEGFGYRDLEKKLPVTPNTLFAIGSSTKAFTSFVIGSLVDEGKLDWNTPINRYLPTFRLKDQYATEHMTPRDLLLHISGLPRHDMMWYNSSLTRKEIFDRLQYLEPTEDFRRKWQYQNMMYMTAGYLAGEVTGTSWEEQVQRRIFTPLGMASSNFSVKTLDTSADAARGYGEREKGGKDVVEKLPYRNLEQIGPAGSINSNVVDMAKWVKLHLTDGTYEGKRLIEASTLRRLHTPQVVIGDNAGSKEILYQLYAMGWFAEAYRGHRLLHHGGNIDGFTALVTFMPDDDIGMVILTNMNATSLPNMVMYTAYDRLLGLDSIDWRTRMMGKPVAGDSVAAKEDEPEDAGRVPNTRPSHKLEEYVGEYENQAYGIVKIEEERDRLKATYNGITSPLEHYHYDVFRATGPPEEAKGMMILFQTSMSGDVDRVALSLEPQVGDIIFKRRAVTMDSATLAQYAGTYDIGGMRLTVSVRSGKTLFLSVPGQPTYEMVPYKKDEFKMKAMEGYGLRFTVEKGKATKVMLVQPNGSFVAKRVDD